MSNRTLLIDSRYLLKRSINGAKDVYTNGIHFGGVFQFFTTLRKLVYTHKVNKVILFWDGENGGLQRHLIDLNYKSNRKNKSWSDKIELSEAEIKREEEKERSVLWQQKRINAYAEELFLRQICVDQIEADDLIAQYCLDHHQTEELLIFTNDRDFLQLLDLNITILFGNIDHPITKSNFYFDFGYHYSNAINMKIICGDTSDCIKGIRGFSEEALLNEFPDLKFKPMMIRDICKMADDINKQRISEKKKPLKKYETLLNSVPQLITNYRLVNLKDPILNDEAYEELAQLEMPLSPENRGSKNLYKMMQDDDFFSIYNSTFVNYVEPFYTIIMNEKKIYDEYRKKQH